MTDYLKKDNNNLPVYPVIKYRGGMIAITDINGDGVNVARPTDQFMRANGYLPIQNALPVYDSRITELTNYRHEISGDLQFFDYTADEIDIDIAIVQSEHLKEVDEITRSRIIAIADKDEQSNMTARALELERMDRMHFYELEKAEREKGGSLIQSEIDALTNQPLSADEIIELNNIISIWNNIKTHRTDGNVVKTNIVNETSSSAVRVLVDNYVGA